MKQVAYSFEFVGFGFGGQGGVVCGALITGARDFFNALVLPVPWSFIVDVLVPALVKSVAAFETLKSSPFPIGIGVVPKRFCIILKLVAVFISNGIGIAKLCATNGCLFI